MSIQSLRERHAARAQAVRQLLNDTPGDKWTPEHQAQYDTAMKEIDDLQSQIDRHQKFLNKVAEETLQAQLHEAADRRVHQDASPLAHIHAKWIRKGPEALTLQDWEMVRKIGPRNTMSEGVGTEGGYTVPTEVVATVVEALKAYGGMRARATVITTETGAPMNYPNSDGRSELGELVGENQQAANQDISFGFTPLDTYKFGSKTFAVPIELLQDSAVDIDALVNQRAVQRIGRITNQKFTLGTGANEPMGVVTAAQPGKIGATGQSTSVIADDLIDLVHAVDPAYRALGHCCFMMNDDTLRAIRKLKDTNGRPIFLPGYEGLSGRMADSLLGYDIQINQDVPRMAANAISILFGDFTFYIVRDVLAATMFRFSDSAFVQKGQIGFLMWMRCGGTFTDIGGAVKYYQNSAA